MILLAIDIGNTNLKLGLFEDDRLARTWRAGTRSGMTDDEAAVAVSDLLALDGTRLDDIGAVAIASVVPALTESFARFARRRVGVAPLVADGISLAPILRTAVERPAEVGADRLVNALAAHAEFGGPAIVVDAGTATTFDAIDAQGTFLGGAISPGPRAMLDALHASTARLPKVDLRRPPHAVGRDTRSAMQSGAVNGYLGLVRGVVDAITAELLDSAPQPAAARVKVIVTGGHAGEPWLGEATRIDAIEPELTLRGLHLAHARLNAHEREVAR